MYLKFLSPCINSNLYFFSFQKASFPQAKPLPTSKLIIQQPSNSPKPSSTRCADSKTINNNNHTKNNKVNSQPLISTLAPQTNNSEKEHYAVKPNKVVVISIFNLFIGINNSLHIYKYSASMSIGKRAHGQVP